MRSHPATVARLISLLAMPCAVMADVPYPAPDCDESTTTGCIARLISYDFKQHVAQARQQPLESGGTTLCIPPRNLELWDPKVRRESEDFCNMTEGFLDPVGRYFSCDSAAGACPRPRFGIALEGGGSKSAPFSLGVLAGLQRSGVLAQTDVIASASGGTYAAYFYFARILDRIHDPLYAHGSEREWFIDCFPSMYGGAFPDGTRNSNEIRWCKEERGGEYVALLPGNPFARQVRYQYQPKVGQDLLSPFQTLRLRGTHWYDVDWLAAGALVSILAIAQAVTMPPHLLMHGLFDFPGNFAPTREFYRSGIERAYGHSIGSWNRALLYDDIFTTGSTSDNWYTGTRFRRSWSLGDLANAYRDARANCAPGSKNCGFPLWVMSTSSSAGRSATFWIAPQPRDMQRFSYELGPHGQGSGLLGFLDSPPPRLALRDAVGISAAFLDDQQRSVMSTGIVQFFASSLLFVTNLEWGTNVANFNVDDTARDRYQFMPWPLYWFPQFQGLRAPYIRLSDGGNVDNLGLIALLRRGVRDIVVSASTDDLDGSFPSLCKVKNELELEVPAGRAFSIYKLHVPALERFEAVCNKIFDRQEIAVWGEEAVRTLFCRRLGLTSGEDRCHGAWKNRRHSRPSGYDLWSWPYPIVQGCVVRRHGDDDDPTHKDSCVDARNQDREISRLLIIKPALHHPAIALQASDGFIKSCHWGNDDIDVGSPPHPAIPKGMNLPCVTLAFLLHNPDKYEPCKHDDAKFPQDNFVMMTLNSSYTMFAAYYDLGRHLGGQIEPSENHMSLRTRYPSDVTIKACP